MELKKQKSYQQAFDLACLSLRDTKMKDAGERVGGVHQREGGREWVSIEFLSEPYDIHFPSGDVTCFSKKSVSLITRLLLLHHLLHADGSPLVGRWVSYKDIPGGLLYAGVFERRVTEPLAKRFGTNAASFRDAGIALGGKPEEVGDASFALRAFPRVPLKFVLWEGDDEFPPSVNVLFDASVEHYLPLEDIVVLGQLAAGRLIHRKSPR